MAFSTRPLRSFEGPASLAGRESSFVYSFSMEALYTYSVVLSIAFIGGPPPGHLLPCRPVGPADEARTNTIVTTIKCEHLGLYQYL